MARLRRIAPTVLLVLAGAWLLIDLWWTTVPGSRLNLAFALQFDYVTYANATRDWLAGQGFYESFQLIGPYVVHAREVMYPPPMAPVLVPFAVLPAPLWWVAPTLVTVAMVWWHHPSRVGLALIIASAAWLFSIEAWLNGNPVIFVVAALALGTRWAAFVPWTLLKPTFAFVGFLHIRRRQWWLGFAAFGAASLVLLPMWFDYYLVVTNAHFPQGPLYNLGQIPLLAIPMIAFATGVRR